MCDVFPSSIGNPYLLSLIGLDMHVSQQVVRFSDTDAAGILYFGSFATYFDESFLSALRIHGIGWDEHKSYSFLLPIVEHKTKFYAPLKFGDHVNVYCYISHIGNSSFKSSHVIENSLTNTVCASGYIVRVVVDYNTFEKREIPTVLKNTLENFQVIPESVSPLVREYLLKS